MDAALQEVVDKQAICDLHARYCRAMDRMDKALANAVFLDDCPVNYHGIYEGSGQDFVDWVWQAHEHMERHSHQITNVLIEVSGNMAVSEAYVTVVLWTVEDESGEQKEIICRGRYLDRLEKRSGKWAIAEREHLVDMHSVSTLNRAAVSELSTRDQRDASWRFITSGPGD